MPRPCHLQCFSTHFVGAESANVDLVDLRFKNEAQTTPIRFTPPQSQAFPTLE
jgi:hypothetical protein